MNQNEEIEIESCIVKLLLIRGADKTICPSEVARQLFPDNWRDKMDDVRTIAGMLAQDEVILITQKNQVVDIGVKGPIRLKLYSK